MPINQMWPSRVICSTPAMRAGVAHRLSNLRGCSSSCKKRDAEEIVRMGVGAEASLDTHLHKLERPTKPPAKLVKPQTGQGDKGESTSLIPEMLKGMQDDDDFQLTAHNLRKFGQKRLTLEEKKTLRRSLQGLNLPEFDALLREQSLRIERTPAEVLQLNIGLYCNQACAHCHVESSPKRTEMMSRQVANKCLELLANSPSVHTVDITGGAPELCDEFRYIAAECARMGKTVIDRCNLTVLSEPGQEDLAAFLASHRIHVVASLPCYSAKNVNQQRGKGVFGRSIDGLLKLNELGYGTDPKLNLDLVYNPLGAFLPPNQEALQAKYKEELDEHFGIKFNHLFAFANMPIKRFADFLYRRGELQPYMELLVQNFNTETVSTVMCTNTVSVGWDGAVYDCDFNQQLAMTCQLPSSLSAEDRKIAKQEFGLSSISSVSSDLEKLRIPEVADGNADNDSGAGSRLDNLRRILAKESVAEPGSGLSVFDMVSLVDLLDTPILLDNHCYGCTAGQVSVHYFGFIFTCTESL